MNFVGYFMLSTNQNAGFFYFFFWICHSVIMGAYINGEPIVTPHKKDYFLDLFLLVLRGLLLYDADVLLEPDFNEAIKELEVSGDGSAVTGGVNHSED